MWCAVIGVCSREDSVLLKAHEAGNCKGANMGYTYICTAAELLNNTCKLPFDCNARSTRTSAVGLLHMETLQRADLHSFAKQCIQICRQHCHQCFALPGAHFCNLALVQNHAANELHVKWTQAKDTLGGLSDNLRFACVNISRVQTAISRIQLACNEECSRSFSV